MRHFTDRQTEANFLFSTHFQKTIFPNFSKPFVNNESKIHLSWRTARDLVRAFRSRFHSQKAIRARQVL